MKKILLVILLLAASILYAQNQIVKDCVMMKNGKVLLIKDGKTMQMTNDVTLTNGSIVTTDGVVKAKDGSSRLMKNGELINMSGEWEKNSSLEKRTIDEKNAASEQPEKKK